MIVELCEHGEAKPHSYPSREDADDPNAWFSFDGSVFGHGRVTRWCPGGRVLEQAIIIERDTDGKWPEWVIQTMQDGFDHGLATTRPLIGGPPLGRIFATHALDALAEAQGSQ